MSHVSHFRKQYPIRHGRWHGLRRLIMGRKVSREQRNLHQTRRPIKYVISRNKSVMLYCGNGRRGTRWLYIARNIAQSKSLTETEPLRSKFFSMGNVHERWDSVCERNSVDLATARLITGGCERRELQFLNPILIRRVTKTLSSFMKSRLIHWVAAWCSQKATDPGKGMKTLWKWRSEITFDRRGTCSKMPLKLNILDNSLSFLLTYFLSFSASPATAEAKTDIPDGDSQWRIVESIYLQPLTSSHPIPTPLMIGAMVTRIHYFGTISPKFSVLTVTGVYYWILYTWKTYWPLKRIVSFQWELFGLHPALVKHGYKLLWINWFLENKVLDTLTPNEKRASSLLHILRNF